MFRILISITIIDLTQQFIQNNKIHSRIMNEAEYSNYSLTYRTPKKQYLQPSLKTMATESESFVNSYSNFKNIPISSISKFVQQQPQSSLHIRNDENIEQKYQQLTSMQQIFKIYYLQYRQNEYKLNFVNQKNNKLETKLQNIKKVLKFQKNKLEKDFKKLKEDTKKKKKYQKRRCQTMIEQVKQTQSYRKYLKQQIAKLERQCMYNISNKSKNRKKKKNKINTSAPQVNIYMMAGGNFPPPNYAGFPDMNPNTCYNMNRQNTQSNPFDILQNCQRLGTDPNVQQDQYPIKANMQEDFKSLPLRRQKTASFGDLISSALKKKLSSQGSLEKQIITSNISTSKKSLRQSPPTNFKNSKRSVKWERDGQQKDVLQVLENRSKRPAQLMIPASPHKFMEASKVNIAMQQSLISDIGASKKPKNRKQSDHSNHLIESQIAIKCPDDSNSYQNDKSYQGANKTRKRSFTKEEKKQSENKQGSKLAQSKKHNRVYSGTKSNPKQSEKSISIGDVVLDRENIKQSYFPGQTIKNEEDEEDDDYFDQIKLNTISRISKQKQISSKSSQKDMNTLKQMKSSILMKKNHNKNILKQKVFQIEQQSDTENLKSNQEKQRRRKLSGTRYSQLFTAKRESDD